MQLGSLEVHWGPLRQRPRNEPVRPTTTLEPDQEHTTTDPVPLKEEEVRADGKGWAHGNIEGRKQPYKGLLPRGCNGVLRNLSDIAPTLIIPVSVCVCVCVYRYIDIYIDLLKQRGNEQPWSACKGTVCVRMSGLELVCVGVCTFMRRPIFGNKKEERSKELLFVFFQLFVKQWSSTLPRCNVRGETHAQCNGGWLFL